MTNGLIIQYVIIGMGVVVSIAYMARKLKRTTRQGGCDSCNQCGGCKGKQD